MSAKVTVRSIRRRTPEEITELARDNLLGRRWVSTNEREIKSAFYMMLAMVPITKAATERIGALIGDLSETVPGRAMNGCPIFLSMGFLHNADLDAFWAETERMKTALGMADPPKED